MNKWRTFPLPVLILALIGIGLLLLFTNEPRYHRRTLTSWLQQCWDAPSMETQRIAEAQAAVRAIGPKKVLPVLLKLLRFEDDPVSLWVIRTGDKLRFSDVNGGRFIRWHSAEDFWWLGERGFEMLGTNAAPAAEALGKLLDQPGRRMVVGKCLESIGKPAEPVVCQALTNQDEAVRQWAIDELAAVTDDVGLYVTRIEPRLHDSSDAVRAATVDAIGNQIDAPELAVPLLVEALKDSAASPNAAGALANFGTNALVAFPILTNLVEHGGIKLSDAALKTLTVIAPDQALPILLRRSRLPDIAMHRVAFLLLCHYPMTPPVESALQTAAADSDPVIARQARIILTEKHQKEHPLEAQFPDDPSYAGKPLGEWLKMHENNGDYPYSQAASNAIHQIGTNAIPALLRRLIYVEPPFGLPAYEVNRDAMQGFILLGDQATPALPQLKALLDGTNQNLVLLAMVSTLGTGTNAIPVLSKALTNQFAPVRDEAANSLAHSIAERFPERRQEIISLLTNLLSDSDSDVRLSVKGDLQDLNLQPLPSRK